MRASDGLVVGSCILLGLTIAQLAGVKSGNFIGCAIGVALTLTAIPIVHRLWPAQQ